MSKEKLRLFTLLAMSGVLGGGNITEFDDRNRGIKSTPEELAKAKGLKEFIIGGKSYWAINYKNAIKKFNKEQLTTK